LAQAILAQAILAQGRCSSRFWLGLGRSSSLASQAICGLPWPQSPFRPSQALLLVLCALRASPEVSRSTSLRERAIVLTVSPRGQGPRRLLPFSQPELQWYCSCGWDIAIFGLDLFYGKPASPASRRRILPEAAQPLPFRAFPCHGLPFQHGSLLELSFPL